MPVGCLAPIFSSKEMDIMPTTIETHYVDVKEYWFRMECLLYKIGITDDNPSGWSRLLKLEKFADAIKRRYGISTPYFMYGILHDYRVF